MAETKATISEGLREDRCSNSRKIVGNMESGELGLEESLAQFEKGVKLAKSCQDTAGQRRTASFEQLIEKNGLQQAVPFEDLDED